MFKEFKEVMTRDFEMMNIGLLSYYLSLKVRQGKDDMFISQGEYANEILKKFDMENCKPVSIPWNVELNCLGMKI